jgi:hypothetical protein
VPGTNVTLYFYFTALRGRNHNKKSPPQEVSCLLPTEGLVIAFLLFFYFYFTSLHLYFNPRLSRRVHLIPLLLFFFFFSSTLLLYIFTSSPRGYFFPSSVNYWDGDQRKKSSPVLIYLFINAIIQLIKGTTDRRLVWFILKQQNSRSV